MKGKSVEKPADISATIKSILDSLAQKQEELKKVHSDELRLGLIREKAQKAVQSLRTQLLAELKKFDASLELAPTHVDEVRRGA